MSVQRDAIQALIGHFSAIPLNVAEDFVREFERVFDTQQRDKASEDTEEDKRKSA